MSFEFDAPQPLDYSGRHIYIRNNSNGIFWPVLPEQSGSPASKGPINERYCKTGYIKFSSIYQDIRTETLYYVPLHESYEVWGISITNQSPFLKALTVTCYVSLTDSADDNLDTKITNEKIKQMPNISLKGNYIIQRLCTSCSQPPHDTKPEKKEHTHHFLGLIGASITSFCGDRNEFTGREQTQNPPLGVETGNLGGKRGYSRNNCSALSSIIILAPNQTRVIGFFSGYQTNAQAVLNKYKNPRHVMENEVNALTDYWHQKKILSNEL